MLNPLKALKSQGFVNEIQIRGKAVHQHIFLNECIVLHVAWHACM